MKNKNIIRLSIVILVSLLIISAISSITYVYAAGPTTESAIDAMTAMNSETLTDTSGGKLKNIINSVIGLIQIVGTGVSMIMVTMYGIKYIMAAPSDKADVKKQIAPMVIGAIILFGAVNLVNIVVKTGMSSLQSASGE